MCLSKAQIIQKVSNIVIVSVHAYINDSIAVGDSKMSAEDMRKVLEAFIEKCQDSYYM